MFRNHCHGHQEQGTVLGNETQESPEMLAKRISDMVSQLRFVVLAGEEVTEMVAQQQPCLDVVGLHTENRKLAVSEGQED